MMQQMVSLPFDKLLLALALKVTNACLVKPSSPSISLYHDLIVQGLGKAGSMYLDGHLIKHDAANGLFTL